MGWRISFGVGPLRYSAPLTRRRQSARRYVEPTPQRYVVTARQQRNDRTVLLVGAGVVAVVALFVVVLFIVG